METSIKGEYPMETSSVSRIRFTSTYQFDCYRDGELVWTDTNDNLVVNEGLELALDSIFGTMEHPKFYLGVIRNNAPIQPEDTMSSHSYIEFTGTTNIYRPKCNFEKGALVGNTWYYIATDVQCMISEAGRIFGAFITTGELKGGEAGTLYGAAMMSGSRDVVPGDALLVSVTVKATG